MAQSTHPPHLLLHNLIVSLSYYGTAVRMLLVGFILLIAHVLVALDGSAEIDLQQHAITYIYTMSSLLLLDAGYVMIARALPIATETVDRVLFMLFLAALSTMVILPYFVNVPNTMLVSSKWLVLVSLFVLALRAVLGLFFGHRANQ